MFIHNTVNPTVRRYCEFIFVQYVRLFCFSHLYLFGHVSINKAISSKKKHCFAIDEHLEHEFSHGTCLELKISIGAFD